MHPHLKVAMVTKEHQMPVSKWANSPFLIPTLTAATAAKGTNVRDEEIPNNMLLVLEVGQLNYTVRALPIQYFKG